MANKETQAVEPKRTVTIQLPLTRHEKDDVHVGLNGVGYLIRRGEPVVVPAGVAEILQHREEMLRAAMEFEQEASGTGAPEQ